MNSLEKSIIANHNYIINNINKMLKPQTKEFKLNLANKLIIKSELILQNKLWYQTALLKSGFYDNEINRELNLIEKIELVYTSMTKFLEKYS